MADSTEYGVFTSNKYAFLDEDGPPAPKARKPKEEKKEQRPKKTNAPNKRNDNRDNKNRDNKPRGEGGNRNNNRRRPRGQGQGQGQGRGKREYDRHVPGTGRRDAQRKGGAGSHNWGVEGDEGRPQEVEAAAAPADGETKTEEGTEGEAGKENATPDNAPEAEPEPKQLTLDEYKAEVAAKAPEEDLNVKQREVDNDAFEGKAAAAFVKKDDDEGIEYMIGTAKSKKGKKRNKDKKKMLNIDEFNQQNEGSNNQRNYQRGGRGGRGGRGERKGNRNNRLDMGEQNFPSLAKPAQA